MNTRILSIVAMAMLALSACGQRDQNSEGNGPGDADGVGGREDPPTTMEQPPATDPAAQLPPQDEQPPRQ